MDRCISMSDGTFFEHALLAFALFSYAVGSWRITNWALNRGPVHRFFERLERKSGGR